jgi:hypothetical protein
LLWTDVRQMPALLERRMREVDVGSQCADTIKLSFRIRCGRGSLDIAGAADVGTR